MSELRKETGKSYDEGKHHCGIAFLQSSDKLPQDWKGTFLLGTPTIFSVLNPAELPSH